MTRIDIIYRDGLTDTMLVDARPKQTGIHTIELLTDEFYKRIDEIEHKQQPVQRLDWDKYQLQLIGIEDYSVDLLRTAKSITITDTDNHTAKILDVQRELAGDTDFNKITLEYYDINLNNYKYGGQPVTNYLRSDALAEQYTFSQLTVLRLVQGGATYDFNTMLDFIPMAAQPEASTFVNTQSGATVTTNNVIKKQYNLIFYLNQTDIQPFQTILPQADGITIEAFLFIQGAGYHVQECSEVTVEKIAGMDIYKCSIVYTYDIINTYNYGL